MDSERPNREHRAMNRHPFRFDIPVLLAALAGGLFLALGAPAQDPLFPATQPLSPAQEKRATPVSDLVRRNAGAVVNIAASQMVTVRDLGLGGLAFGDIFDLAPPRQLRANSVGSGVMIHPSGYILTNAHVVAQATDLKVIFCDGSELPAEVIASAPRNELAILRVQPPAGKNLPAVKLGRSDDLMVGETVVAVGNPVGLHHTVTMGIVSAVKRELRVSPQTVFEDIIQTDAAINPGSSGGPLFNILGEMIGINTAIRTDAQNVGFAIPIDQVKKLLPELLAVEGRGRVRLGIKWGDEVERDIRSASQPAERVRGVTIARVEPKSPADQAGLTAGLVVTRIADRPTPAMIDALLATLEQPTGKAFAVNYLLATKPAETKVTIEEIPKPDGAVLAQKLFGLTLRPLDQRNARRMGLRAGSALMVVTVEDGSPAGEAGVEVGDLVTQIDDRGVRDFDEVGAMLEPVKKGSSVFWGIVRVRGNTVLRSGATLVAK